MPEIGGAGGGIGSLISAGGDGGGQEHPLGAIPYASLASPALVDRDGRERKAYGRFTVIHASDTNASAFELGFTLTGIQQERASGCQAR